MENTDLQRIRRIRRYCEDIAGTIKRFGANYEVFAADTDYLNSVSMSILQIGELSVGLTDAFKGATKDQMQWSAIRGMRNMYAHAYAKMDKIMIWETATKDIPELLQFCDRVLEREKPSLLEQLAKNKKIVADRNRNAPVVKEQDEPEL